MILTPRAVEIRHFHLFSGLGGGAKGFNRGRARVGHLHAQMRCVGGIDVDRAAVRDFERLAGVEGTCLDLFSREQYIAFHGKEPPAGWREATPDDIRQAAGGERPHIGFGSAPCKGFSGLLSEARSGSAKYQALNQLALRGLWLALEAWKDDPLEFWLWENVPRIATRGRAVLDQMIRLLEFYGYVVAETTHDCGELGGLGQSRKRFLLVARHREKVPPFLYEPPKRPLRSVGDIIGRLPVPGPDLILPMHRLPRLQWQTWLRLAFVEAGSDWRSLNKLRVADGILKDFRLQPGTEWYRTALGVQRWSDPSNTVTSEARPQNGRLLGGGPSDRRPREERADGRRSLGSAGGGDQGATSRSAPDAMPSRIRGYADDEKWSEGRRGLGVIPWDSTAGAVTSQGGPAQGSYSIADPRMTGAPRFNHVYRIVPWSGPAPAIAGGGGPAGGLAVADPRARTEWGGHGKYVVAPFDEPANTVIAASTTGNGAFGVADPRTGGALCVADPRVGLKRGEGDAFQDAGGAYGVLPWHQPSGTVAAASSHDNGRWTVADPRQHAGSAIAALPAATDRLVAVIRALDGTFHRPFTTLELAALQSLVDPDEILELDGTSDSAWRERIGNAVPPAAAEAIASVMAETLLLAWTGETFTLTAAPIWVRQIAVALSVDVPRQVGA